MTRMEAVKGNREEVDESRKQGRQLCDKEGSSEDSTQTLNEGGRAATRMLKTKFNKVTAGGPRGR